MSIDILSSFAPFFLALFLASCLIYRTFRVDIKRWWHRAEAIKGFSTQKRDKESHKDDDYGI